jgi:uncharacterized protein YuzE
VEKAKLVRKTSVDYDAHSDVLYINFGDKREADDSDVTEEGVIIRSKGGKIVGLTVLNARKRLSV